MYNFALTGAAGYIAPRHLKAIKETGNRLVAAVDPHDSVGILDSFFPEAAFFTEFERFDRHLEKLRRGPESDRVNYVSICSPNHLHDAHIRQALRVGAHVICEKPLVLNPWNLEALQKLEEEYGKRIYTILQLRLHPAVVALSERLKVKSEMRVKSERLKVKREGDVSPLTFHLSPFTSPRHSVQLTYVAPRGRWYDYSWKGDSEKSGGIATNIGIHFFDLLLWLFGGIQSAAVDHHSPHRMSGTLELERANVSWSLSIENADLPEGADGKKPRSHRAIVIDDEEVDLTGGFEDLHTLSYREILTGRGFTLADAAPSIELVHSLRRA